MPSVQLMYRDPSTRSQGLPNGRCERAVAALGPPKRSRYPSMALWSVARDGRAEGSRACQLSCDIAC